MSSGPDSSSASTLPAKVPPSRLARVARVLPVLGVILVILPALWSGDTPVRTSQAMIYIFAIWVLLIIATYAVRRAVTKAKGTAL